jgi:hypothetical protein
MRLVSSHQPLHLDFDLLVLFAPHICSSNSHCARATLRSNWGRPQRRRRPRARERDAGSDLQLAERPRPQRRAAAGAAAGTATPTTSSAAAAAAAACAAVVGLYTWNSVYPFTHSLKQPLHL